MTRLVWDKVGQRLYETGIDHGVLYIPNPQGEYDNGFAWNGLTSVTENFSDDAIDSTYYDGVKISDSYPIGDYSATLNAYTYPDEFLEFEGMGALGEGAYVDDQSAKLFGLTYRTLIGNDTEGLSRGYKIHLLYNLMAVPSSLTFQNGSNPSDPLDFSWTILSVPEKASPYRPTAHIIVDSSMTPTDLLQALEDILYGESDTQPRLPSLSDLLDFVFFWNPRFISPEPVTGLSPLLDGTGDLTQTNILGIYSALPTTTLVESSVDGLYYLNRREEEGYDHHIVKGRVQEH